EVTDGAPLLELETDKATTEVVATQAGFVTVIDVVVGQVVPVGARLAVIGETADAPAPSDGPTAAPDVEEPVPAGVAAAVDAERPTTSSNGEGRLRAAPVARRAARRLGLPLDAITGTGPRGRITLRDV